MEFEVFGYTALGDRRENEDAGAFERIGKDGLCAMVCDGLGGQGGGREASRAAVEALLACRACTGLPTAEQLQNWMTGANEAVLAKGDRHGQPMTTAVILFLRGNRAVWAHLGDTRLYHFHNGTLAHYTNDHSLPQLAVKLGQITRQEIPGHPDRSRVTKALGMPQVFPELAQPITLASGDHAFLLCSDGLWERLLEEELALELQAASTPEQWVNALRCRAQSRKACQVDNHTAVAVFVRC